MILSNNDILQRVALDEADPRHLGISPFVESNVQPASYDITLSNSFLVKKKSKLPIDIHKPVRGYVPCEYDSFILYPKDFVLATTKEVITLPNDITAQVQGRSSIGRLGVFVQNAGWIDPGFTGEITLELFNASKTPVKIESGMRIAQLIFAETLSPSTIPYNGKYRGQTGARGSLIFKDYEETKDNGTD